MVRLVELFGSPGAGKTTLARAAVCGPGMLTQAELTASWRRTAAREKAVHIRSAFLDSACTGAAVRLAFGAPLTSGDSLRRLTRMVARTDWVRSQSAALLLHQGYLQDLWSILYSARRLEPDPELLSPLLRSMYRGVNAQIVFIDVEPEIATARVATRNDGHSRLDGWPRAQVRDCLSGTSHLLRTIISSAKAAGLDVAVMDGTAPVAQLAARLQSVLTLAQKG